VASIEGHAWPGNARTGECIKRAVIMAEGNQITAADVGFALAPTSLALSLRR
jgi:two-component system NtrC family response regulator